MPAQHKQEIKVSKESTSLPQSNIDFRRADDYFAEYANNAKLDSSNWDLKLTFGEIDLSFGPNVVVQKFGVTIPWPQAKVLHYFLTLHLLGHEAEFGRIIIPTGIIPAWPKEAPPGVSEEIWKKAQQWYEEFITKNPEAATTSK